MDAANLPSEADDDADLRDSPRYRAYRAIRDDPEREARWVKWREDHAQAISAWNDHYEKHGHPLEAYMIKPFDLPR